MVRSFEHEMVVLIDGRRVDAPTSAHAEMEDQGPLAIRMDEAVFGPPPQTRDAGAGQGLHQV
jgi:hypothetical protein